jgi:hypothetical protein
MEAVATLQRCAAVMMEALRRCIVAWEALQLTTMRRCVNESAGVRNVVALRYSDGSDAAALRYSLQSCGSDGSAASRKKIICLLFFFWQVQESSASSSARKKERKKERERERKSFETCFGLALPSSSAFM